MTVFQAILEKIKAYYTIIIHRHQRPDPDAIGSQVGLKEILKTNFPDKKVLATGVNEPTLSWIAEMDEVTDQDYEGALVIVTDTANTPRIDDDRYDKGDFLIKIDHHPNDDAYGDLLLVDTTASSASEIVTDWALSLGLSLSDAAARVLYNGIVGDTGRFLFPSTTPKTLQIAAKLREYDFDFAAMARRMDSFPFKIAKLQGYVFDNLDVDENGAARVVLTRKVLDDFNITDAESSAIVGTPGRIDSVESWVIVSSRIPGLATSNNGTLLAIFDARYDLTRDLQGNIDIALHRSFDKGLTWQPIQTVLDMGEWGGLPQKFNGVSDACILVDKNTNDIYIAGLWMHGALDDNGKWIEGLNENSTYWIHQWRKKGSQPGIGLKETCQFLITKSTDDGLTWSFPDNITGKTKRPEWWLFAPAPGQGITLADGTLVFPTQGRDEKGTAFSNITYSKDHGKTWMTSNPAYSNVTECNAAQLSDGTVMLNMRDNRNRGNKEVNGRRICTTTDLGETWTEHSTSRKALVEPTCMASLHRHDYTVGGEKRSILLFANPSDYETRDKLTLKVSFDDGMTWPEKYWILFDQYRSAGYSSITSIDENSIGILYESSQANMAFIKIDLTEILNR